MTTFALLAREALGDAVRRRIAGAVAVASLLSLLAIESCTSCATGTVTINGEPAEIAGLPGATGAAMLAVLSLWIVALAGIVACDHLTQTLEDGSALLVLARPVRRASFALARLTGALGVAWGAGALLFAATVGLLLARSPLPLAPALVAAGACALGGVAVASLAMAASLALPRVACALGVVLAVGGVAFADALAVGGAELSGWLAALARFGPALAAAPLLSLDPWVRGVPLHGEAGPALLRSALWAAGGVAVLVLAFRRVEPGSGS